MATANSAKKPKGMNKKSLQHFEKRLQEERKRVLKELGRADEAFGATPQSADGDLSTYSFQQAARIEPTVGLQISQPNFPLPCFCSNSSKVRIWPTLTR